MLQARSDVYSFRTLDSFGRCEEKEENFVLQADSKFLLTGVEVVWHEVLSRVEGWCYWWTARHRLNLDKRMTLFVSSRKIFGQCTTIFLKI